MPFRLLYPSFPSMWQRAPLDVRRMPALVTEQRSAIAPIRRCVSASRGARRNARDGVPRAFRVPCRVARGCGGGQKLRLAKGSVVVKVPETVELAAVVPTAAPFVPTFTIEPKRFPGAK